VPGDPPVVRARVRAKTEPFSWGRRPETECQVIDYEGDPQRTRELAAAAGAGSGGMTFEVATECGMARIDERGPGGPTLERLLTLHAEVAAPVR